MPLHPLRVHARDGQQQRRPEGVLGPLLLGLEHAGRLRVGLGGPGHPAPVPAEYPGPRRPARPSSPTAAGGRTGSASTTTRTSARTAWSAPIGRRIPGLSAIKYVYRNIHAEPVDLAAGRVSVKSWFDFVNAKDVAEGTWSVVAADGRTIASGTLPELDLAPGAAARVHRAAAGDRTGGRGRVLPEPVVRHQGGHLVGAQGTRDRVGAVEAPRRSAGREAIAPPPPRHDGELGTRLPVHRARLRPRLRPAERPARPATAIGAPGCSSAARSPTSGAP